MNTFQRLLFVCGLICIVVATVSYLLTIQAVKRWVLTSGNLILFFTIIFTVVACLFVAAATLLFEIISQKRRKKVFEKELQSYLHDSVLQNLAVIQNMSTQPKVRAIARAQEKQLREYLYDKDKIEITQEKSLSREIELIVETFEINNNVEIEYNAISDITFDEIGKHKFEAIKLATIQAIQNAVSHGEPSYSVTLEVNESVNVYIRDHGKGFSLEKVPNDRLGVKVSIIERIEAVGGKVTIKSNKNFGTELRICVDFC